MSLRPRGEAPRGEVQATAAQPYYVTLTERLTMSLAERRQSQTPTFIERSEDKVISTKRAWRTRGEIRRSVTF